MMVKTYRDLLVWQKGMTLVIEVYKLTNLFPREELYGLTSQIRRSAVSLPSNIAEGHGRNTTQDYIRFLYIANGSLYELQTQVEIALNLEYVSQADFEHIYEQSREIERMLSRLIQKLESK